MNKNAPKIRCKCPKCGARQMVKIDEYLRDAKCIIGRSLSLANPPCDGKLEYFSDDTQDTLLNAANMLRWLTNYRFERESVGELVDIIADDL